MPAGERHRSPVSGAFIVRAARHARHSRLPAGEKPTTGGKMTTEDGIDSNFRYGVMAARRARQLQNGSQPLIDSRSNKACRVAQEEIAAGKVTAAPPRAEVLEELVVDPHEPHEPHDADS